MAIEFAKTIKNLRTSQGLSQLELADKLFVTRSTVARWETGTRVPDATMIIKIAEVLGVDVETLIAAAAETDTTPTLLILDDEQIILQGGAAVLKQAFPDANVVAFCIPNEALKYAQENRVDLAFIDIEMGQVSGFDVCRKLLDLSSRTQILYLTAYREYSFDAWSTGASGFLLKPLTVDSVKDAVGRLPRPIMGVTV